MQRKWRRWWERFLTTAMVLAILLGIRTVQGHTATQDALEEVRSLSGQTWCKNSNQVDYAGPDGVEIENVGGWPCVTITRIVEARAIESDLCAYVVLNQEAGLPGESLYREASLTHCSAILQGSSGFRDALFFEYIRPTLNSINSDLCTRFRAELREEDWYEFC